MTGARKAAGSAKRMGGNHAALGRSIARRDLRPSIRHGRKGWT